MLFNLRSCGINCEWQTNKRRSITKLLIEHKEKHLCMIQINIIEEFTQVNLKYMYKNVVFLQYAHCIFECET